MMRPVITNFSSGELDPRLEGRVDLPMVSSGARELTNFFPPRLGGAFKRGGLLHRLVLAGQTRLIPWNVSYGVDLMLAISNLKIRIIDVSGNKDPAFLTTDGTNILEIAYLDGQAVVPVFPAYTTAQFPEIQYAISKDMLILTCKGHPPFYFKVNGIDSALNTVDTSYGVFGVFGSVAFNAPSIADDEAEILSSQSIADAMANLTSGTTYACDAGSYVMVGTAKKMLKSVTPTIVIGTSNIKIYSDPTKGTLEYTLSADSTNQLNKRLSYPVSDVVPRYNGGVHCWAIAKDNGIDIAANSTYASIFAQISAISPVLGFGESPTRLLWMGAAGDAFPAKAIAYSYPQAKLKTIVIASIPSSYSIVLTYYNYTVLNWLGSYATAPSVGVVAGDGYKNTTDGKMYFYTTSWGEMTTTVDLTPTNAAPMDLECSIVMLSQAIKLNGSHTYGARVFDAVASWMKRDEEYQCDQSFLLDGVAPQTATKTLVGGQEVIVLKYPTAEIFRTITRESVGLTGQLGVIVTPLYTTNPEVVGFHQGRLVFGAHGNTLFLSKPNDQSNFSFFESIQYDTTSLKPASDWVNPLVPETREISDITQQVGAGSGMRLEISTEENEDIQWVLSVGDLVIGTSTTEWVIPAAVNAMNPQAIQTSRNGSAKMQAKFVGDSIVFISPNKKAVRAYNPGARGMSPDISEHAASMFTGTVVAFDFRQSPNQEMYFVLSDGQALRLVMGGEVPQWSRIKPAGWAAGQALIEGVAIIAESTEDAVFFSVRRILDGATTYNLERLSTTDDLTFDTRNHLDASQWVADTGAGHTITVARLEGLTVNVAFSVIATGVETRGTAALAATTGAATQYTPYGSATVIDIPISAHAWVGLAYTSRLETFRLDSPETEGLMKGGSGLHMRVYKSGAFTLKRGYESAEETGAAESGYDIALPVRADTGAAIYPYSGPIRLENDAPSLIDQSIVIESTDDQPVNILLIAPSYSVEANG
jgi:hypothetical protein